MKIGKSKSENCFDVTYRNESLPRLNLVLYCPSTMQNFHQIPVVKFGNFVTTINHLLNYLIDQDQISVKCIELTYIDFWTSTQQAIEQSALPASDTDVGPRIVQKHLQGLWSLGRFHHRSGIILVTHVHIYVRVLQQ
jgi:hypothetical protein